MAIKIIEKKEYPVLTKKEDTLFWSNFFKRATFHEPFMRDIVRVRMPNGDIFKGVICSVGASDTIMVRTAVKTHGPLPMSSTLIERIGKELCNPVGGLHNECN